jgi:hypothetical protein
MRRTPAIRALSVRTELFERREIAQYQYVRASSYRKSLSTFSELALIAPKSFTSVAVLRLETAEKPTIEDKLGVSDKTGEPISGSSAEHPSAFGLGVGAGFRPAPGAYFPKSGAVIVAGLNSQPDDRRNQMALNVHRGGASAMRAGRLIRDAARLVCWRTSFPLSMLSNVQHVPAIMRIRSVPCLSSSRAFSV